MTLEHCLILGAVLFCVGLLGAFTRRNAVVVLFSIEIMLNAANLNFIAFWRFSENPDQLHGPLFTLFTIAVAANQRCVGSFVHTADHAQKANLLPEKGHTIVL